MSYYKGINQGVSQRLGGHHNAKILLSSVNFAEFVALKEKGDWDTQAQLLCDEAKRLENAGADFIILATNTMHKMAKQIEAVLNVPFLHLADATARRITKTQYRTIGLLGTKYTMTLDFYKERLIAKGITPLIPNEQDIEKINNIIYDELCHGVISDQSRCVYLDVIAKMKAQGAQGIILGCTEITMLINDTHTAIPLFDTTKIHIEDAVSMIF